MLRHLITNRGFWKFAKHVDRQLAGISGTKSQKASPVLVFNFFVLNLGALQTSAATKQFQHKPSVHPLEQYLTHLAAIRNTGATTPETSFYPPLAELLNAVGQTRKPKIRAVNQPANTGAGIPDGGLFAESQFKKRGTAEPLPGQMPERGVIEIKSPKEDVAAIADTKQITKYWQKYKLVLITNYRDFLLTIELSSITHLRFQIRLPTEKKM